MPEDVRRPQHDEEPRDTDDELERGIVEEPDEEFDEEEDEPDEEEEDEDLDSPRGRGSDRG